MEPIRTLIVDDELLARTRIRNLLRGRSEFQIAGECANGREAVVQIEQQQPDLMFLDVQMPDLDGFGLVKSIDVERLPVIVFVTAYDQYAVRAFECHALDYLLKPFDDERFEKTLSWAKAQIERNQMHQFSQRMLALLEEFPGKRQPTAEAAPRKLSQLMVKSGGRVLFVKTEEIDWIEAEGCYARLHTGRQSHLLRETMSALEAQLDQQTFLRIHRSTIINRDRIRELLPQSHGEYSVVLQDGTQLRLSRSYRDKLSALLG
ncbi:MAG TPA: LytTR family DNA-binding domain-containing protein [Blastocatellia bacterium]|nr:LytTR family DNA-binding domain-containing protein [Blastocatellia bacterium]HMV85996.1 LytTR family DNA-binding domain-containing protein [Blastocatellia bacterium]HMX26321.1 LytTR family DNA-binding domain-containing protein [Blastocatellia bacterium]HMY75912.1 LytTR family DNA-binding domain-containing protein [Blastocatellia bacterium]HMZ22281.1 LytTR family DNA-binding domain-containing protein [Blastocatellia bacterium]